MTQDIATPRLNFLSAEQKNNIHSYALKILTETGVRVDVPESLDLFRKAAGQSTVTGNVVHIPPDLVEWAIKAAPSTIDIYDRGGDLRFTLGDGQTRFGIGVTTLFYQRPEDDKLEPFARRHMGLMTRLGDTLPNFDVISTVGIVQDVPPKLSDLVGTLEMTANTRKPLVVLVSDEDRFPAVMDLLEHLHGDLSNRPFIIPYFNPVTPLVLNRGTLEKMNTTIQRGLPLIFSNYSMAGMSTPITPAGTLSLLLAELLAGLVAAQLMKEGAPVILGILPAWFDMKTMVNFYEPQSILMNLACAEMMAHYGLPHAGTSGSGTGLGPDLLAAETYWMNHLTSCLGKVGLAPFVGDTLTSKAFSPVNVVFTHEIIEQSRRFANGMDLDEKSAVLEEIRQVGPGGSFLATASTMERFRKAYYTSPVFPRWSMEKWQAEGCPTADSILRRYTVDMLNNQPIPPDSQELLEKGDAFIAHLP